ncbi:hypothetical protein Cenrod_0058 [Candidatus Symbiobacter mobilis CR]|uniref:Uncharacterized protein n=1 Tax=Candidatus Symbiobacter mobilis CR TaxID=946483 RepID=U5N7C3_9BURK|nr:hypothetical protein Cenrod_0058 [Candidatus Symbiobacter mobilis CR]
MSDFFIAVVVLRLNLLSRCCFGLGAVHGLRGVCTFSAPPPNPAVKRDTALKRVAPYF